MSPYSYKKCDALDSLSTCTTLYEVRVTGRFRDLTFLADKKLAVAPVSKTKYTMLEPKGAVRIGLL